MINSWNASKKPIQANFDASVEKGGVVEPNAFVLELVRSMLRLHTVVKENCEISHVEAVFKQIFRQLVQEIDKFYTTINTDSKFAKKRVRVDLTQIQKCVASKDQNIGKDQ